LSENLSAAHAANDISAFEPAARMLFSNLYPARSAAFFAVQVFVNS
jgi:hypothetical protein